VDESGRSSEIVYILCTKGTMRVSKRMPEGYDIISDWADTDDGTLSCEYVTMA
jgi:hypothetical protein